jgi:3-methyladenine DNA glycosylase AlkD
METDPRARLAALAEDDYRRFAQALVPTGRPLLGVRLPRLRALAKDYVRGDWRSALAALDAAAARGDDWAEERLLSGALIGAAPLALDERLALVAGYVPRLDSWAAVDGFVAGLRVPPAEKPAWRAFLAPYLAAADEFAVRFAVVLLLFRFKAPEDHPDALAAFAAVRHPGYFARMAVAWAVAERYPAAPEATRELLASAALDGETHRLALRKLRESRRLGAAEKAGLAALARKKA